MAQWLTIGLVSAWDLYLSVKLRTTLHQDERNPLGRYLLRIDNDDISLLAFYKFVGTIFVLGVLVLLYEKMGTKTHRIMIPIFLFQLALLYYLQNY